MMPIWELIFELRGRGPEGLRIARDIYIAVARGRAQRVCANPPCSKQFELSGGRSDRTHCCHSCTREHVELRKAARRRARLTK
jgi:hypothetical protein